MGAFGTVCNGVAWETTEKTVAESRAIVGIGRSIVDERPQ